jgi:hypothetical protein
MGARSLRDQGIAQFKAIFFTCFFGLKTIKSGCIPDITKNLLFERGWNPGQSES